MSESVDTIFALSSGRARSGVAVVRLSGPHVSEVLNDMCGGCSEERYASLRTIVCPEDGSVIDRGVVLYFGGPRSFTGEDCAEFQVHGSLAVIDRLLSSLARQEGLRPAEPGEFARRAFGNGKLDLTEIEGLADLIDAETEGQRKLALRQMEGSLGSLYDGWRERLVSLLAYFEAEIDFPDEGDVGEGHIARCRPEVSGILSEIKVHLSDDGRGERLREGVRVVIAGAPNVGKSSLLNALARRDVAIVSDEAGTTRDVLETRIDLGGVPVILTDTAGLRASEGAIEQEGIRRALEQIASADVVVRMRDGSSSFRDDLVSFDSATLSICNKVDLPGVRNQISEKEIGLSVRSGEGLDAFLDRLKVLVESLTPVGESPVLTRERHRAALTECAAALDAVLQGEAGMPELMAEDLRRAVFMLGRITGRVDVEDILDVVFGDFCIGK